MPRASQSQGMKYTRHEVSCTSFSLRSFTAHRLFPVRSHLLIPSTDTMKVNMIFTVKLSIALMLIRIAQNRKVYVWAQWAMMGLFFVADGGSLFYIIFQCTPVSYAWNTNQDGFCLPATYLADVYYACTAVNIMTDWVTAILPIPLLWNVRLERSEKLSVAAILGLGIL